MDNRYEVIVWRGHKFDRFTVQALKAAEFDLGRTLTIYQGSYNTGVGQSAGTHDGGGAVDCWVAGMPGRLLARELRLVGFAAWYRPELIRDGVRVWGPHVHAVQLGNARVSPEAAHQVAEYLAGGDGLAGDLVDIDPWRPPVVAPFEYMEDPMGALLTELIALRKKYRVSLVKVGRVALRGALENAGPLRASRIRTALTALPKE